jgi:hypothetical protein
VIDLSDFHASELTPEVLSIFESTSDKFEHQHELVKRFCYETRRSLDEIPFDKKYLNLRANISHIKIDWREGHCTLNVNRTNVLEESKEQLRGINLFKELKINFLGEVSFDAGGIIREWFTVMFKEILSEETGLFERADSSSFSYKIKRLESNKRILEYFNLIGVLMAKAILENITINICFNRLIYKMILGEAITLDNFLFYDQMVGIY